MYKVLFFDPTTMGAIEDGLNDAAEEGYRAVGFYQSASRMIIVMEKQPGRGRPKKEKEEETSLGE